MARRYRSTPRDVSSAGVDATFPARRARPWQPEVVQPAIDLVTACIRSHGGRQVFGDPFGGLEHRAVGDARLATMFADADGRHHGVGVAYDAVNQRLHLSSRPSASSSDPVIEVLDSPLHITRVVEQAARAVARDHTTHVVEIACDLAQPIASRARPAGARDYAPYAGAVVPDGPSVAMLAGPYVARRRAVGALHAFAAAAGIAVANTWGAKGLYRWDSPHHAGTVGLQQRDFELVFDGIDIVIAVGLDPDEARPPFPTGTRVVALDPQQLGLLAHHVGRRPVIAANPLYERLAAIAQPGYRDERRPFHPARLVAELRAELPPDGVVTADPGPVGLWIARTFSTTELGSVVVPAAGGPGVGALLAATAALGGRQATYVTTTPDHPLVAEVGAVAAAFGARFAVRVWDDDERPVDWGCTRDLVGAAGPVAAWA